MRALKPTGLSTTEAASILTVKGIIDFSKEECHFLVDCYASNPLFMKIAATTIQDLSANSIAKIIAQGNIILAKSQQ